MFQLRLDEVSVISGSSPIPPSQYTHKILLSGADTMDDGKGRDAKILNDITQYFKISGKRTMHWIMEGARCNIKISITKDIPKYSYQQGRIQ